MVMSLAIIIGTISVEPVTLFYIFALVLSNNLSTNLLLYKSCDPTSAKLIGSKCNNEVEAQHAVAFINGWKFLIQQALPIGVAMIAGTWSDRHGRRRKPVIMLPIIGQILADMMSLYSVFYWTVSPQLTAAMQAITTSCTGATPMFFNGINSYAADTTSKEGRTVKFGMVNTSAVMGSLMGIFVFGKLVNISFMVAYMLVIGLGLVSLAMSFLFVKSTATDVGNTAPVTAAESHSFYSDILHTVNPVNIFRSCHRLLTKRRDNNGTTILWLAVLICAPLTCVPKEGEMTVTYCSRLTQNLYRDDEIFSTSLKIKL